MLKKPIFIIGHQRSGTSLLRTCIERSEEVWTIGREGKPIFEKIFHPKYRNWHSNALDESDLTEEKVIQLKKDLLDACRKPVVEFGDRDKIDYLKWVVPQGVNPFYYDCNMELLKQNFGHDLPEGPPAEEELDEITPFCFMVPSRKPTPEEFTNGIRMLEKSIQSCFRIPFLKKVFPDSKYIFLIRDGRASISSSIESWRDPRCFFSYQVPLELKIKGYSDIYPWGKKWWNLCLPPGWRDYTERSLEEVCAYTWVKANTEALRYYSDLKKQGNAILVKFEDLLKDPVKILTQIAEVIEIKIDDNYLNNKLPVVMTGSGPDPEKWRKNSREISKIIPMIKELQTQFDYSVEC
ncbi:MAG: sulfotransferase [Spirochaetales bacterium]|nr:sulfotransferase [Spirochaetales bacterium]